jgi:hypothetical protein
MTMEGALIEVFCLHARVSHRAFGLPRLKFTESETVWPHKISRKNILDDLIAKLPAKELEALDKRSRRRNHCSSTARFAACLDQACVACKHLGSLAEGTAGPPIISNIKKWSRTRPKKPAHWGPALFEG